MRLVVLEMDRLAIDSVNWGRMVAGMLSQGVTMVVMPDASQHVSAASKLTSGLSARNCDTPSRGKIPSPICCGKPADTC